MRRLASFENPESARALSEGLSAANIASELRTNPDRGPSVWVLAESDLPQALRILAELATQPEPTPPRPALVAAPPTPAAPTVAASPAPRVVEPAGEPILPHHPSAPRPKTINLRKSLRESATRSPVTFGLIALSMLVALVTQLGDRTDLVSHLSIAGFERTGGLVRWHGYQDLARGELWRLITPIFIHFGPFHLLFNAFWLNDLGSATERVQGSLRFVLFIMWSAAVSNIAQLLFGGGPNFGGMSGVVYALIGYLWARGRTNPGSGIAVPNQLVGFFVAWMALGFSGLLDRVMGPMANYCHLGGFVAGVFYGFVAGLAARRRLA